MAIFIILKINILMTYFKPHSKNFPLQQTMKFKNSIEWCNQGFFLTILLFWCSKQFHIMENGRSLKPKSYFFQQPVKFDPPLSFSVTTEEIKVFSLTSLHFLWGKFRFPKSKLCTIQPLGSENRFSLVHSQHGSVLNFSRLHLVVPQFRSDSVPALPGVRVGW